jgi:hypothetical protein
MQKHSTNNKKHNKYKYTLPKHPHNCQKSIILSKEVSYFSKFLTICLLQDPNVCGVGVYTSKHQQAVKFFCCTTTRFDFESKDFCLYP